MQGIRETIVEIDTNELDRKKREKEFHWESVSLEESRLLKNKSGSFFNSFGFSFLDVMLYSFSLFLTYSLKNRSSSSNFTTKIFEVMELFNKLSIENGIITKRMIRIDIEFQLHPEKIILKKSMI